MNSPKIQEALDKTIAEFDRMSKEEFEKLMGESLEKMRADYKSGEFNWGLSIYQAQDPDGFDAWVKTII